MKLRLHHPLWTHLPALACIAVNLALLLSTRLPARVPTHFNKYGLPDDWGSPLNVWIMMIGVPLILVIGSAVIDELHARHQQERRFNWASLLDELLVAFLAGVGVEMIPQLSQPDPILSGQWQMVLIFSIGSVALAALLEFLRPYRPGVREEEVDVTPMVQSIQPQIQQSGRWMYWERHNTIWWRCIVAVIAFFFALAAGDMARKGDYGGGVFCSLMALFSVFGYGGFRTVVTPGRLRIRSWSLGLTFLRLKLINVNSVKVMWFNALADFFGWGLYRYSPSLRAWGFVLGGRQGVMIQMKNGRKFFISSSSAEKLAAATEAARIAASHS
jgi:hypothetical protein